MQAHVYVNEKDRKRQMAEMGQPCAVPLVVDVPWAQLSTTTRRRAALWRYPLADPPVLRFDLCWRPAWFPWHIEHLPHTPEAWEQFVADYVRLERERIEYQLGMYRHRSRMTRAAAVLGVACAALAWCSDSLIVGVLGVVCFAVAWRYVPERRVSVRKCMH